MQQLAQTYRPDSSKPELTVKNFLKNEEVRSLADTQLLTVYEEKGISVDFLVTKRIEIMDNATKDKQHSTALKALEGLEDNIGLRNKIKVSEVRKTDENGTKIVQSYQTAINERDKIKTKNVENEEKTRENTLEDSSEREDNE